MLSDSDVDVCIFPHNLVLCATERVPDAAIFGRLLSTLPPGFFFFSQAAHSANLDAGIFRIYQEVSREGLQTIRTYVPVLNGSVETGTRGYISEG